MELSKLITGYLNKSEVMHLATAETISVFDKKFGLSEEFRKKLINNAAGEKMYCLKPRLFVLFDQVNFPDAPRQEWRPKGNT